MRGAEDQPSLDISKSVRAETVCHLGNQSNKRRSVSSCQDQRKVTRPALRTVELYLSYGFVSPPLDGGKTSSTGATFKVVSLCSADSIASRSSLGISRGLSSLSLIAACASTIRIAKRMGSTSKRAEV